MTEKKPLAERLGPTAVNLLFSVVALIVFLCVAELGARAFYFMRWGKLYPLQSMQYSLRLGWRLAPGQFRDFSVNSAGFRRADETDLRREPGGIRIFLVGGSAAFGSNGLYPQFPSEPIREETIDHSLELLLRERFPGRTVEVINAAVPEYRLFQETSLYSEMLLNYDPDLVIFLDGHNDISFLSGLAENRTAAPLWNLRHFLRGERVLNARSPLDAISYADLYLGRTSYAYHILAVILQRAADRRGVGRSSAWGENTFTPTAEADMASDLAAGLDSLAVYYTDQVKDLADLAARRSGRVIYALQPELVDEDSMSLTTLERRIQAFAFQHHRDRGTFTWRYLGANFPKWLEPIRSPTFDVVDLSRIAMGGGDVLYTDYTHMTAAGNRRVAELLLPRVMAMLQNAAETVPEPAN